MIVQYSTVTFSEKVMNPLGSGGLGASRFQASQKLRIYRDTENDPNVIVMEATTNGHLYHYPFSAVTTAKVAESWKKSKAEK